MIVSFPALECVTSISHQEHRRPARCLETEQMLWAARLLCRRSVNTTAKAAGMKRTDSVTVQAAIYRNHRAPEGMRREILRPLGQESRFHGRRKNKTRILAA